MLLALDVGNTNITAGVFNGKKIIRRWRHETTTGFSAKKLAAELRNRARGLRVADAIYGSVVPRLDGALERAVRLAFGCRARAVSPKLELGIKMTLKGRRQIGADLLLNALAGYEKAGGACMIVDFGTATTVQGVSSDGHFLGGAIVPGPGTSAWALAEKTALLPLANIGRPSRAIGRDTAECLRSGIYYGSLGMIERLLAMFKKEMRAPKAPVFATGGLSGLFREDLPKGVRWEPDLTLDGLRIAHERMEALA
ncbi:MAG TPA: type III pantothenate kinase [Elusimicrobiota bacterium]|nr:type III pantothenate kinase [Elusimicrobiota bacterium]